MVWSARPHWRTTRPGTDPCGSTSCGSSPAHSGEDLGTLLGAAERGVALRPAAGASGSITVDVAEVMATDDPRLAPVKRWFELRTHGGSAAMTLDDGAIAALASLMNVSAMECRRILISTIRGVRPAPAGAPTLAEPSSSKPR